jgi:hypothetical protein
LVPTFELLQFEWNSKREVHKFCCLPTDRQISMLQFDSAGLAGDCDWAKSTQCRRSRMAAIWHRNFKVAGTTSPPAM